MPPRFAYWTIILDGIATSFRAHDRAEILPTFNQLKKKDPAALLKWFSGGKLWDSPEQAKELRALERVRQFREERKNQAHDERERGSGEDPLAEFRKQHGRPVDGSDDPSLRGGGAAAPATEGPAGEGFRSRGASLDSARDGKAPRDKRSRDWRPGGEHKDPRDKYKLPPGEARKRWKDRNLGPRVPKPLGKKPFGSGPRGDRPFGTKPGGDRPFSDRPRGPKPFGSKPGGDRPFRDKPSGPGGPRPFGAKPFGDRPRGDRPYGSKPGGDRPFGDRPRGPKPFGSKPGGDRPFRGKPSGPGGPRPFGGKPGGQRSFGGPSGHRQAQGRPEQGRGTTRDGQNRSLRAGKPRGPGRRGPR